MQSTPPSRSPFATWALPALALVVGVLGMVAIWLAVFLALRGYGLRWCAFVAPLVALDLAFMLNLASAPAGRSRAWAAAIATVVAIALGLWMLAAAEMGRVVGIHALESALRLGPVLAWELIRHGTSLFDLLLLAVAPPLAWRLAR